MKRFYFISIVSTEVQQGLRRVLNVVSINKEQGQLLRREGSGVSKKQKDKYTGQKGEIRKRRGKETLKCF